jgi:thymidylate kinase
MKLLIIEGTDRTGKDSLVNEICKSFPNAVKRHWSFPQGTTNEEKTQWQKDQFLKEFKLYKTLNESLEKDSIMIWNRSHIGELVYGSVYRNSNPKDWVMFLEYAFDWIDNPEIFLVYLYADAEFVVKHDDGNSYSAKLADKKKELEVFREGISLSSVKNTLKIKVNEGDEYINQEHIFKSVKNFIS